MSVNEKNYHPAVNRFIGNVGLSYSVLSSSEEIVDKQVLLDEDNLITLQSKIEPKFELISSHENVLLMNPELNDQTIAENGAEKGLQKRPRLSLDHEASSECAMKVFRTHKDSGIPYISNITIPQIASSSFSSSISSKFQTAKGSRVSITKEAMSKAAELFNPIPASSHTVAARLVHAVASTPIEHPPLAGTPGLPPRPPQRASLFQTAKGRSVSFSAEAMRTAGALLSRNDVIDTADVIDTNAADVIERVPLSAGLTPAAVSGFRTARGARVSVSRDALDKATELLTAHSYVTPIPTLTDPRNLEYGSDALDSEKRCITPGLNSAGGLFGSRGESRIVESELDSGPTSETNVAKINQGDTEVLDCVAPTDAIDWASSSFNLSHAFLAAHCPCALVDVDAVQLAQRKRRLASLAAVTSETASWVTFDDFGGFAFDGTGILTILLPDLSQQQLSQDMIDWIGFQLKWIIWTLASYERRFPDQYLGLLLHLDNVKIAVSSRYSAYYSKDNHDFTTKLSRRFKSKSCMSPLQRCCEIHTLVWPIVVCFCISKSSDTYKVTDGWWWATAVLDTSLLALVTANKLKDGCKIVVLSSSIAVTESCGCTLELKINCVRKARNSAKLGFVHPKYLGRGISAASIKADGGPVVAVHVTVLHVSPIITKVKLADRKTLSKNWILLDSKELSLFNSAIQKLREASEATADGHEDLSLAYLVEDIDCDDNIKSIILCSERGLSSDVSESDMQEAYRVMEKLRNMRERAAARLLADDINIPEITEQSHRDILVRCNISSALTWIRFASRSEDSAEYFPQQMLKITNLKTLRSNSGTPLLLLSPSSAVSSGVSVQSSVSSSYLSILSNLRVPRNFLPGTEISVCGYVLASYILEETSSTIVYNILISDESRAVMVLRYSIPALIKNKVLWFKSMTCVTVHFALFQHFDSNNDIIQCCRGDHTYITVIYENIGPSDMIVWKLQEESRRFDALCSGKSFYLSTIGSAIESCGREYHLNLSIAGFRIGDTTISLRSISNPSLVFLLDTSLFPQFITNLKESDLLICTICCSKRVRAIKVGKVDLERVVVWIEIVEPINHVKLMLCSMGIAI